LTSRAAIPEIFWTTPSAIVVLPWEVCSAEPVPEDDPDRVSSDAEADDEPVDELEESGRSEEEVVVTNELLHMMVR
jgi:hypothetical protein